VATLADFQDFSQNEILKRRNRQLVSQNPKLCKLQILDIGRGCPDNNFVIFYLRNQKSAVAEQSNDYFQELPKR